MLVVKPRFKTSVSCIGISPDGRWLVASPGYMPTFEPDPDDPTAKRMSFDLKFWPLPKPTQKPKTFPCLRPREFRFLPNGEMLLHQWAPDVLSVHRFPDGTRTQQLYPDREHLFAGEASPDGRYLFVNTFTPQLRPQLRLWDLAAGAEVKLKRTAFKHDTDLIGGPSFHPAGDRVASNPRTHITDLRQKLFHHVAVWSFPEGKLLDAVKLKKDVHPGPVRYSPDGRWLVAANANDLFIWDAEKLDHPRLVEVKQSTKRGGPVNARLSSSAFTRDGRFLAVGCYDGTVRFFDTTNWAEARVYDWGAAVASEWHRQHGFAAVRQVEFTPDGAMGVAAVGFDIVLWDLE